AQRGTLVPTSDQLGHRMTSQVPRFPAGCDGEHRPGSHRVHGYTRLLVVSVTGSPRCQTLGLRVGWVDRNRWAAVSGVDAAMAIRPLTGHAPGPASSRIPPQDRGA